MGTSSEDAVEEGTAAFHVVLSVVLVVIKATRISLWPGLYAGGRAAVPSVGLFVNPGSHNGPNPTADIMVLPPWMVTVLPDVNETAETLAICQTCLPVGEGICGLPWEGGVNTVSQYDIVRPIRLPEGEQLMLVRP